MKARVKATGDIIELGDLDYYEFVNKFVKNEIEFIDDVALVDVEEEIDYLKEKQNKEKEE